MADGGASASPEDGAVGPPGPSEGVGRAYAPRSAAASAAWTLAVTVAARLGRPKAADLAPSDPQVLVECTVPYKYGEFLAKIHKVGTVLEEDFAESGTRIVAYLPPSLRNKLQAPARPPSATRQALPIEA